MENLYKKLYYMMFNGTTDALEELEKQNYGSAKEILRSLQQKAEELYLTESEETN